MKRASMLSLVNKTTAAKFKTLHHPWYISSKNRQVPAFQNDSFVSILPITDGEYQHGSDGSLERNGYGVHTTTDGAVYEGEWKGDKMNGRGKLIHPSGAVYDGEFVNNQFHGQGKYTWKNNSFYEGQFNENK